MLKEKWEKIPTFVLVKLVDSILRHCEGVMVFQWFFNKVLIWKIDLFAKTTIFFH
jgi:hypothetical protein